MNSVFEHVFAILGDGTSLHATSITISWPTDSPPIDNSSNDARARTLAGPRTTGEDGHMSSTEHPPPDPSSLRHPHEATQGLVRTVDGLGDDAWRASSGLPGWTRAHVVAHLALNAEGLTGVLAGLARGQVVAMYPSNKQRDRAIDELAAGVPSELRGRLLGAGSEFDDALSRVPQDAWSTTVPRTPGGTTFPAWEIAAMRRREIEIHHADLDAGYDPEDWPADFVNELLDVVTVDHTPSGPFQITATDLGHVWLVGGRVPEEGIAMVSGLGAALGWWLTGRGDGAGVHIATGALPKIGPWRRTPAQ